MAPGRRQGGSCWTCRLRRKRCDSIRPICGGCQTLEITCYSGETKPQWMDGGTAQKRMSETIKDRIKQSALLRRERRRLVRDNQGTIVATERESTNDPDDISIAQVNDTSWAGNLPSDNVSPANSTAPTISTNTVRPSPLQSSLDGSEESRSTFTTTSSLSGQTTLRIESLTSAALAGSASPINVHLGSVMIYLDYVFPFLFPFYQPSITETGRQWLLGLLCQNEVSFHIAASLSAYFFSLVPQGDGEDIHDDCKALVLDRLVEQMDMAVRSIHGTVSIINHNGTQNTLLDRVRIMEEITQLLIVEVTVRRNLDWRIHLTPALVLSDEIFKSHGINSSELSLADLLNGLPSTLPVGAPHHKPLPYTADQSALVFFVSLLLFIDIIASTSLSTPPTLQQYHDALLSTPTESQCRVRFESIVGCQNWALIAIGKISALCAWKRDAKQSGNFSVLDLVSLAALISKALDEGLSSLETSTTGSQPNNSTANKLSAYYSRHDKAKDQTSIANVTRIWAYAAKIYLSVSISGWQTKSVDTQTSVVKILSSLREIESPAQLRSLSWPIAVAGCLASPNQEHEFRRVIGDMGQLGEFGTLFHALRIMEAVWSSRDAIAGDTWDIASCLSVLGSPALLL